jgi:hypothetical protein
VETISSGSLGIDLALGVGGPRGRVIEIYGQNPLEDYIDTSCYCRSSKAGGIAFIDADTHSTEIMLKN